MSIEKGTKINQLLSSQPMGIVFIASWLIDQGYSASLQARYRKGNWMERIGAGAMIRSGDKVGYEGAVYALQTQAKSMIHPAGRTALSFQGKTHYMELLEKKVTLFGGNKEKLPMWFQKKDWGLSIDYYQTTFLPSDLGLVDIELKNFSIKVSNPTRAVMECLFLAPEKQELVECYELMEGLNNLRPQQVQILLEECQSVKVKRLFLYMAEKINHSWFRFLDVEKIDMGKGKRSITKKGVYISKYQITVPEELENYGKGL